MFCLLERGVYIPAAPPLVCCVVQLGLNFGVGVVGCGVLLREREGKGGRGEVEGGTVLD